MVLSTHAVVGASIAGAVTGDPLVAFAIGVTSHFAIDAIPHWGYKLKAFDEKNATIVRKNLPADLAKIFCDFALGVMVCLALFGSVSHFALISAFTMGALGGVFPDLLQLPYFLSGGRWFKRLQRFHITIQTNKVLAEKPLAGVLLQLALVVLVYSLCALASGGG
jgi:hypothetical protein